MNERMDLYRNIHKGIRAMLADVLTRSGRTDFTDAASVAALTTEVRDIFELLEGHAHTEDTYVMPLLRRVAPKLASQFDEEHEDQEARLPGLLAALERHDASRPLAAFDGHRIALQISRIAGELLTHMADEELEINPTLWSTTTDEELMAVEQKILASIAPDKMGRYLRWMVPAMNAPEREAFKAILPPPVREFVETLVPA